MLMEFVAPAVVLAVIFLTIILVMEWRKQLRQLDEEEKEIREDIRWWLKGGKPNAVLRKINYEFNPRITSNAGKNLLWPEYKEVGGGTRRLFRYITFFGSDHLSPEEFLEHIVIIGHLTDVEDWYERSIEERKSLMKERFPKDYYEKLFT